MLGSWFRYIFKIFKVSGLKTGSTKFWEVLQILKQLILNICFSYIMKKERKSKEEKKFNFVKFPKILWNLF